MANKTKKILVVIDMQNDFINGALGTKEAVEIVDNVVEKIKNFDGLIYVTLDTHSDNYMQTLEGKKLPVPHCIITTDGWTVNEKISDALADKNTAKIIKSTFGSVELVNRLKEELLDSLPFSDYEEKIEIELVGVCTDICVVSNALLLKAHFPEMEITVDASCCAGVTPETHRAALETMKMCQINVIGE